MRQCNLQSFGSVAAGRPGERGVPASERSWLRAVVRRGLPSRNRPPGKPTTQGIDRAGQGGFESRVGARVADFQSSLVCHKSDGAPWHIDTATDPLPRGHLQLLPAPLAASSSKKSSRQQQRCQGVEGGGGKHDLKSVNSRCAVVGFACADAGSRQVDLILRPRPPRAGCSFKDDTGYRAGRLRPRLHLRSGTGVL